ncbi:hypothetical protein VPNG_02473 [Cytospora leucostoma]|uniref:NodB homology domain-containing protein n=1 Tax=Cytospora leucostoma TaxID=1230097 RepID=A0A423XHL3_9PEZI|nr:hypothetical protein VPNG_02473 [Cytospora leucostoma]
MTNNEPIDSSSSSTASPSPWPNGAKCAISFTMDNLGEAQDVNKGLWPGDEPVGQHPSVLSTLPRILDLLDRHGGTRATYFAESWSLDAYPGAVAELRRRGHEVAWHGYQHETWHHLSGEEEALSFERSFAAAGRRGVAYEGFRPPGGELNGDRTYALLRRYGVRYVSPLGALGVEQGVVVLPFLWEAVDAFWYMPKFSAVRVRHGRPGGPLGPADFREYLFGKVDEAKRDGGYVSILFHPFLQTSEERLGVLEEVLARISGDAEIWCAPCADVARWVREHAVPREPIQDTTQLLRARVQQRADGLERRPDAPLPLGPGPHLRRDEEHGRLEVARQPLALLAAQHLLDGHQVRPLHLPDVPGQALPQLRQEPPEPLLLVLVAVAGGAEVEQPAPQEGEVLLAVHGAAVALARAAGRPREDEEVHGDEVPGELPAEALLELALVLGVVGAAGVGEGGVEFLEGAVVALDGV